MMPAESRGGIQLLGGRPVTLEASTLTELSLIQASLSYLHLTLELQGALRRYLLRRVLPHRKVLIQGRVRGAQVPMIGFIGRLDYQKGADLVLGVAPWLLAHDVQLVCLGTGDPSLEVPPSPPPPPPRIGSCHRLRSHP